MTDTIREILEDCVHLRGIGMAGIYLVATRDPSWKPKGRRMKVPGIGLCEVTNELGAGRWRVIAPIALVEAWAMEHERRANRDGDGA